MINGTNYPLVILLGYYDGPEFVADQVQSIFKQTCQNFTLHIFDDNSKVPLVVSDLGLTPVQNQRVEIHKRNKNLGYAGNFLDALSGEYGGAEYFAFSDQDDIWREGKLEKAISVIQTFPYETPVLYCSRTESVDRDGISLNHRSPLFKKSPSFSNALVQSIGGGNTMVFNKAARDLIVTFSQGQIIVSHDWWCYQVVSGAGGVVHYDPTPYVEYRQHETNLIGSNVGARASFKRFIAIFEGRFQQWNDINLQALWRNQAHLSEENRRRLADFIEARRSMFFKRLFLAKRAGIHRQTFLGNCGLLVAILFNKL